MGDKKSEDVYSKEIKFSGVFDLKKLYKEVHDFLESRKWKALTKDDYYETYYYHKVFPDGKAFIEIKWKAKKNFWSDEFNIDWFLDVSFNVDAYNFQTKQGSIKIKIKASHELSGLPEPETKGFIENILTNWFKISKDFLSKSWKKTVDPDGKFKKSASKLFSEMVELEKKIYEVLGGVFYK